MTGRCMVLLAGLLAACTRSDAPAADTVVAARRETPAAPTRLDSATAETPAIDALPSRAALPSGVPDLPAREPERTLPSPGSAQREALDDIVRLEARVRTIANSGGCSLAAQCATIAIGAKPCGGPRGYLAYCADQTDETALRRAAEALRTAEERYNRRNGIASTCDYTPDPGASMQNGRCTLGADTRVP